MKKINMIKQILPVMLIIALMSITSCKKNFEEINTDPNSPKEVPTSFLLTGAEKGLMDFNWDEFWGGYVGNQLAQYWSSNQYTAESRYAFRTNVTSNYWGYFYSGGHNNELVDVGGMEELVQIIRLCTAEPEKYSPYGDPANQIAVATILKVWQMQRITDIWGDAPYSEAWQGAENTQPKYDSQRDIYMGMRAELDAALSGITGGTIQGDIIYGGDMSKWAKFGNSLKIRLAMRMSDRESAISSQMVNEAVSAGVFEGNADDALFRYLSGQPSINPLNYNHDIDARNDYAASNTMVDIMNAMSDPRISEYFSPAEATGTFVGEVYGLTEANGAATEETDVSQRNPRTYAAESPGIFMTYSELEFLLAEAVERGYINNGTAEEHYNKGITASFDFWGVSDVATYLARTDVAYSSAPGSYKEKIGKQKWLALYMQGIEAWSEWRRLDFGILQPPADGYLEGNCIPLRLKYPFDEATLNGPARAAAVASQGPDEQCTRLWWDVQ